MRCRRCCRLRSRRRSTSPSTRRRQLLRLSGEDATLAIERLPHEPDSAALRHGDRSLGSARAGDGARAVRRALSRRPLRQRHARRDLSEPGRVCCRCPAADAGGRTPCVAVYAARHRDRTRVSSRPRRRPTSRQCSRSWIPARTPSPATSSPALSAPTRRRIDALRPHVMQRSRPTGSMRCEMLADCLALTALLGISGETLSDLALTPGTGTEYERLRKAADALFAAFRTKYGSDDEFRKKIEPYEDTLRSRKRDGLVAFIRFTEPAGLPARERPLRVLPARRPGRGLLADNEDRGGDLLAPALRPSRAHASRAHRDVRRRRKRAHPARRVGMASAFQNVASRATGVPVPRVVSRAGLAGRQDAAVPGARGHAAPAAGDRAERSRRLTRGT